MLVHCVGMSFAGNHVKNFKGVFGEGLTQRSSGGFAWLFYLSKTLVTLVRLSTQKFNNFGKVFHIPPG